MANILEMSPEEVEIPFSILDTDLYKLTMQNAVLHHFYDAEVVIRFTNRTSDMLFNRPCFDWIQERVNRLSTLKLQSEARTKLKEACPYFSEEYLDYLQGMRLHPEQQVKLGFVPKGDDGMGEITCSIEGVWRETILYEVPILAIFSEAYFKFVDTDWEMDRVQEKAKDKAIALLAPSPPTTPAAFSEFGTRRRRSFQIQDLVLRGLIQGHEELKQKGGTHGVLTGTSNVYLALKYGLKPIGTIAHEWIMAVGATYGYKGVNSKAMDLWEEVYPSGDKSPPLTMLTDTFTVKTFFDDFTSDPSRALRWGALRHDSGDPFEFIKMAKDAWTTVERKAGIERGENKGRIGEGKMAVFSDSLDVEKALQIQAMCDEQGMAASFGIGTFLTNDFKQASNTSKVSKPLNIVIKLNKINGRNCVKLSDDIGKYTGNVDEVKRIQEELGLPMEHVDKRSG